MPDGRVLLATTSGDGTVRLWDPATGTPVGDPLTGHTGSVSGGGAVRCRTGGSCSPPPATTGRCGCGTPPPDGPPSCGDPLTGHTGRVTGVAAVTLPDGRVLLATTSDDGTVRLWDPATGHAGR